MSSSRVRYIICWNHILLSFQSSYLEWLSPLTLLRFSAASFSLRKKWKFLFLLCSFFAWNWLKHANVAGKKSFVGKDPVSWDSFLHLKIINFLLDPTNFNFLLDPTSFSFVSKRCRKVTTHFVWLRSDFCFNSTKLLKVFPRLKKVDIRNCVTCEVACKELKRKNIKSCW